MLKKRSILNIELSAIRVIGILLYVSFDLHFLDLNSFEKKVRFDL